MLQNIVMNFQIICYAFYLKSSTLEMNLHNQRFNNFIEYIEYSKVELCKSIVSSFSRVIAVRQD